MKKILVPSFILFVIMILSSCKHKKTVDTIVHSANIYTVDSNFTVAQAMAIKEGKIVAIGANNDILEHYQATEDIDAAGKFIYPGFWDAHAHFYGYAKGLQYIDLRGIASFEAIIQQLKDYNQKHEEGWILGWGWDQNLWKEKIFPEKHQLDKFFPNRPVMLTRVDGHVVLANAKALAIAGIDKNTHFDGGKVMVRNGELTGILIDKAADVMKSFVPKPDKQTMIKLLQEAQQNCLAVGLTHIVDAGYEKETFNLIDSLQKEKVLIMNLYVMLHPSAENFAFIKKNGIYRTENLHVRSIKVYADGALGSRGAWLLKPYTDDNDNVGIAITPEKEFDSICKFALENNYQMCTHAIGDAAVRFVLNAYAKHLTTNNDKRWRIEHAQVVDENDFHLFKDFAIIPCINTTHATSDMEWAEKRLGSNRIKNAYAYKKLLQQNNWLANGSDFPIEAINPLFGFYAAIHRRNFEGQPAQGFMMENALTREEALKAMTIWAAKACFEEKESGSLEVGKFADFVVFSADIMKTDPIQIPQLKVESTYLKGQKVY